MLNEKGKENIDDMDAELKEDLNSKKPMSYGDYRILATKEDMIKLSKKIKPFGGENIPIIGCIIYQVRMGINQMDIDRGILRKEIMLTHLIFVFAFLVYGYLLLTLITPYFTAYIYSLAVKRTQKKLECNDI